MRETITLISNWVCIAGFVITIITLLMTINIKGQLSKTMDKQQYLKERENILKKLHDIYDVIQINDVDEWTPGTEEDNYDNFISALLEIHRDTAQLENYKFWPADTKKRLCDFNEALSSYVHLLDECAHPDSQKPRKYNDRARLELLERINRVIAILKKESTVL